VKKPETIDPYVVRCICCKEWFKPNNMIGEYCANCSYAIDAERTGGDEYLE